MKLRHAWIIGWLACLGCHSLVALKLDPEGEPPDPLWEQGQAAMRRGQAERAIQLYEQSLANNPSRTRNHLSLAAAHVEAGNDDAACEHLGQYLASQPEHFSLRVQYGELLLKLHRSAEARVQFERFISDAPEGGLKDLRGLIHGHGRLMDIAEQEEDAYAAHLHRGIGLFLLASCRAKLPEPEEQLPVEGLLWKAIGELTQAHDLCPAEAQPCWYLYSLWRRLGQRQNAMHWLRQTIDTAPFSLLTPAEQRGLQMAQRGQENLVARSGMSKCLAPVPKLPGALLHAIP
jgi:tetratricopeptide (TPR) repeat protein